MFVLDNSGSIRNRFGEVKNLVRAVVNGFDVNDNAAHFGVITYRENGTVTVPLPCTNRAALENEIDQLVTLHEAAVIYALMVMDCYLLKWN